MQDDWYLDYPERPAPKPIHDLNLLDEAQKAEYEQIKTVEAFASCAGTTLGCAVDASLCAGSYFLNSTTMAAWAGGLFTPAPLAGFIVGLTAAICLFKPARRIELEKIMRIPEPQTQPILTTPPTLNMNRN